METAHKKLRLIKAITFLQNKRDFRNIHNEFLREAQIWQIFNPRSPWMSVPRERIENHVNQEALKPLKVDLFNVKPQIFNGGGNYK